jgi:hypothetical protein
MKCKCGQNTDRFYTQIGNVIEMTCRIHTALKDNQPRPLKKSFNQLLSEMEIPNKKRGNCIAVVNLRCYNLNSIGHEKLYDKLNDPTKRK